MENTYLYHTKQAELETSTEKNVKALGKRKNLFYTKQCIKQMTDYQIPLLQYLPLSIIQLSFGTTV